ncbi:hypothetical protein, partial [Halorubrum tibetense]
SVDHAAFKARVLNQYQNKGWVIAAGFGDSSTDFEAYAQVGLEASSVFALQRQGEGACLSGAWAYCFNSWSAQRVHLETWIQNDQKGATLD